MFRDISLVCLWALARSVTTLAPASHASMGWLTEDIHYSSAGSIGVSRRLGVVYAEVEEIQEMMPIHPNFQRKAVKVHMHLQVQVRGTD